MSEQDTFEKVKSIVVEQLGVEIINAFDLFAKFSYRFGHNHRSSLMILFLYSL